MIIDELEKMDMRASSALLSLMTEGIVARLKKGMTEEMKAKTWVFSAVNKDDKLPLELNSRFPTPFLPEHNERDGKEVLRVAVYANRPDFRSNF